MRPRHPSTQATAAPAPSIPLPRGPFAPVAQRAVTRPATSPGYIAGLFAATRDGGEFAVTTPPSRTPATRPVAFALLRMLLLEVAKALLGHTDVRLTLNLYRHVRPGEYERAAAAMERRRAKL